MFESLKFFNECRKFYGNLPVKGRGRFFADIKELFEIYRVKAVQEDKQREIYELMTKDLSEPIIRDIAEQVVNLGVAWTMTSRDGIKHEIVANTAYEQAKKFENQFKGPTQWER